MQELIKSLVPWLIQLLGIPAEWLCQKKHNSEISLISRAWWNFIKHTDYHTHGSQVTQLPLREARKRLQAKGESRRAVTEKKMTMCLIKSIWKIMMLEVRRPKLCLSNRHMKIKARQGKAKGEGALCVEIWGNKPKPVLKSYKPVGDWLFTANYHTETAPQRWTAEQHRLWWELIRPERR